MRTKYRKSGRVLLGLGLSIIYVLSVSLVSNILIRSLEDDYHPLKSRVSNMDAIVVLTSGVRDLSHLGLSPAPDETSLYHLVHGIEIYRKMRGVPLVISGGRADPTRPEISIGEALGRKAIELGVPKSDLIIEDDSKNTYEGALRVNKILSGKDKIALVTSAYHMGRSVKLYKKAGFEVSPAPTNFLGGDFEITFYSFIPTANSLKVSSTAIYEYFSRSWYVLNDFFGINW